MWVFYHSVVPDQSASASTVEEIIISGFFLLAVTLVGITGLGGFRESSKN